MYLRQSTAATVELGPFVGVDGLAESTALSSQTGRVVKNGTSSSLTPASWAYTANGNYAVGLSTGHTDTLGRLRVAFQSSASYLPVWREFVVLHANVYDWLFGTTAPASSSVLAGLVTTVGANGAGLTAVQLGATQSSYAPATASVLAGLVTTVGAAGAGLTAVQLGATQSSYAPTKVADLSGLATGSALAGVGTAVVGVGTDVGTVLTRLTATRAGYLDNLAGGAVALASQIPASFTSALFASAGVFSSGALANAPAGGGGAVTLSDGSITTATFAAGATLPRVTLVDATTALTGKTGFKLAADGLDAIATAEPTVEVDGPFASWTFPQLLRWLVSRFSVATLSPTSLTVKTLAGSTSTVQTVADDGFGNEATGGPT